MTFIVKIPGINGLGKTKGCEKAPNEILKILEEIHSNESGVPIDKQLLDLEEIHLDNGNIEDANKLIYKNTKEIFQEKPKTIFLGGDHSVSYSTTKAFLDYCNEQEKKPCLIMLDNMKPKQIKDIIAQLKKKNLYDTALIEISGGITPETLVEYSKTGADVVSLGYLTKSSRSLDIKQQIVDK